MVGKPLSTTMMAALAAIHDHGGFACAMGGGWWKSLGGKLLYTKPGLGLASETIRTQTIYALETRGMLARLNQDKRSWKDAYAVTEAGVDLLKDPTDDHH